MPILNMVWWGTKWGNIWEPLNLTVTSVGLDATITWEDNEIWTIPPTSFAKSELVRKIGSAPTSPSDWDLVVTETVKDTYKVSGYTDSWLTDWTTYYYRVFSYSDLGGISYCDAVSVTIDSSWHPWANTVAYYPLDTDFNDASDNNYDLTNSWWVITTLNWVSCAYYDWASYSRNTVFSIWATRTISVWVYVTSTNTAMGAVCTGDDYSTNIFWIFVDWGYWALWDWRGAIQHWTTSILNWWHLLTWVLPLDWQTTLYIDGNFEKSYTFQIVWWWEICIWAKTWGFSEKYTWYVSKVIIEDKAWTLQEIQDYFDQTKWDYWIS